MIKKVLVLAMLAVVFAFQPNRPIHIFMIGDSTMANKKPKKSPETGWGQVLNEYFTDAVVVDNHSRNGRSSKSFRDEGLWAPVDSMIQKGDYVIIQFGHNDQKPKPDRHTDPGSTFNQQLKDYINQTRAKGGFPILCTSIVRRHFISPDSLKDTHGDYITAVIEVGKEMDVPVLDMEAKTRKLVGELGPEKSKELYLFVKEGHPHYKKGKQDSTHLNVEGAHKVAEMAIEEMKKLGLPLVKYLK